MVWAMAWKRRKVRSRPARWCQSFLSASLKNENEKLTGVGPEPDKLFNESRHCEVMYYSFIRLGGSSWVSMSEKLALFRDQHPSSENNALG